MSARARRRNCLASIWLRWRATAARPEALTHSADLVLGFDFGVRQIGVAVGEVSLGTARGLRILKAKQGQPDWQQVATLLEEWQPGCVVVGLPLNMDGSES
ncbi:MAG: Holliday junction resolvase RuvX, partial [Pseudomonadales bacterium]|nr:Holliday junction resolvase RuvX [Pseudomonadales bacterium]